MAQTGIIVPVYNAETFLSRCVDSILCQSNEDYTLILVDDESPDGSGAICDAYAEKDKRIKVIHQKNGGAAAARNAGMDYALKNCGCQWLTFVDSDDWVEPNYLKTLYDAAIGNGCKMSACGFYETTGESRPITGEWPVELMSAKAYFCGKIHKSLTYGPCNKLYHRSILENLRFPTGKCVEDEYFIYRAIFAAGTLAVTMAPLYAYYSDPSIFTTSDWSPKRLDAWDAYEEQLAYFKGLGDGELVRFRYRGYLENAMVNWKAASESLPKDAPVLRQMKKRIRSLLRRAWKDGCLDYWIDHEILSTFRPLWTRGYCFYWETLQNIRRRFPWLQ